ncbi:MAG: glycosyltransferase family 4 protein [Candidatus Cryptobacteroides sp.]
MRIAIEAQRIFRRSKHGMDFVILEIIRCLQQNDKKNEYWVFVAPGEDVCLSDTPNFHIEVLGSRFYPMWEQVLLPRAVKRVKADILHCTSNTAPLFPPVPLLVTLHDVICLEKEENGSSKSLYQRMGRIYSRFVVPKVVRKCRKVITVSEYEKRRIVEKLGLPQESVEVVYNGFGKEFNESAASDKRNYLLFLGATAPKKNTKGTLLAYSIYLEKSEKKLPLKIADLSMEHVKAYLSEIGKPQIMDKIECTGYVPHSELPALYGGAAAFLYTSFRESFGIPQLEAMACLTPVVVSDKSALPEIAGPGAVYADPYDAESIAQSLLRLETDLQFMQNAVEYGKERISKFSWEKSAEKMLSIYESATGSDKKYSEKK